MPASTFSPEILIPNVGTMPGPWWLLSVVLFVGFLVHLVTMNIVVGVTLITLVRKVRNHFSPQDRSGVIAQAAFLPKGIAFVVNFGVVPFLFIQGAYAPFIYSSSVLMAVWSFSVMLLVMLAYYGLYIATATRGFSSGVRTAALLLAALLLLWNAFLFVNNMTLLQSPERWIQYATNNSGTVLNLSDPQIFPRYLHIILACIAIGGLWLGTMAHRRYTRLVQQNAPYAMQQRIAARRQSGLQWFMYATLLQIPVGCWFFMALPEAQRHLFMGGSTYGTVALILSLFLTGIALFYAKALRIRPVIFCMGMTVLLMAGMRSLLRASLYERFAQPEVLPAAIGPIALFLGSFVLSAFVVVWMLHIYRRRPMHGEAIPLPYTDIRGKACPSGEGERS